jgi:hypothetical protein
LLTRRQFIKVGLAGAMVFATVRLIEGPRAAPAKPFRVLDEQTAGIVAALAPVILAGALPAHEGARASALREVVEAFDRAVSGMAPAIQDEIGQLFGFLAFAPTRTAFTGVWTPLEEARPDEIRDFLARWRVSRFDLQRVSYEALTQLVQASWYGNPLSWAAIRYPGPPVVGREPASEPRQGERK